MLINKNNIKVLTPDGYKDFEGIKDTIREREIFNFTFSNGLSIRCTHNHKLLTKSGFVRAEYLSKDDLVKTKEGFTRYDKKSIIVKELPVYDLVNVGDKHEYYTNGIVSHNCSFSGSSYTLIKADYIENMKKEDSIEDTIVDGGKLYREYNPNAVYLMCVDSSKSLGGEADNDFLSVNVLELNSEIHQAFTFRTNTIHYKDASQLIYDVGIAFGEPLCVVENNEGSGTYIVNNLHDVLEYENVYFDPNHDGLEAGVRTTKKNRPVGLQTIKKLIESNILHIVDPDTIDEFKTFIKVNKKYEADKGSTDDCIMSLCVGMYVLIDINNELEITIDDYISGIIEEIAPSDSNDVDFYESSKKMSGEQELLLELFGDEA